LRFRCARISGLNAVRRCAGLIWQLRRRAGKPKRKYHYGLRVKRRRLLPNGCGLRSCNFSPRKHGAHGDPRFWPVEGQCFAKVRGNSAYDCSQQPSNPLADPGMGGPKGHGIMERVVNVQQPYDPRSPPATRSKSRMAEQKLLKKCSAPYGASATWPLYPGFLLLPSTFERH